VGLAAHDEDGVGVLITQTAHRARDRARGEAHCRAEVADAEEVGAPRERAAEPAVHEVSEDERAGPSITTARVRQPIQHTRPPEGTLDLAVAEQRREPVTPPPATRTRCHTVFVCHFAYNLRCTFGFI
jgi:hypothetical protein